MYGLEKVWRQVNRETIEDGVDRVARLTDDLELSGVVRGKTKRTGIPDEVSPWPADLLMTTRWRVWPTACTEAELIRKSGP